jgi:hypothetical protein
VIKGPNDYFFLEDATAVIVIDSVSYGTQFTLIDGADFDSVWKYRWRIHTGHGSRTYYASTHVRPASGHPTSVLMHRLLTPAVSEVDHINGDGLDNRRCNLRKATRAQNASNITRRAHNRSGYIGVSWDAPRRAWQASVATNGRSLFLGRFANPQDAARARDKAARALHGEFAVLNFPDENLAQIPQPIKEYR